MLISIGQAATVLGVAISTLRRWEKEGRLLPHSRTKGGHRRYHLAHIEEEFFGKHKLRPTRKTVIYARVSSADQKLDLERPIAVLKAYCRQHKYAYLLISDLGSGINYHKRGLNQLMKEIGSGQVERLILTHRDRLLRFGTPLLFKLCDYHHTKVEILGDQKPASFEEELVKDVLEVLTVFCSKLYGRRSHEHRRRLQAKVA